MPLATSGLLAFMLVVVDDYQVNVTAHAGPDRPVR